MGFSPWCTSGHNKSHTVAVAPPPPAVAVAAAAPPPFFFVAGACGAGQLKMDLSPFCALGAPRALPAAQAQGAPQAPHAPQAPPAPPALHSPNGTSPLMDWPRLKDNTLMGKMTFMGEHSPNMSNCHNHWIILRLPPLSSPGWSTGG
eukprot:gene19854-biopygen999